MFLHLYVEVYSTEDIRNPVQNYSWVFMPYCTGDVHVGQAKTRVAGYQQILMINNSLLSGVLDVLCNLNLFSVCTGADRIFDGHANLQRALERAVATWDPRTLVVGGQSAGGFGSVSSFAFVRDYFPKARAVLIDDSGPVVDDTALAPCLQEKWRQVPSLAFTPCLYRTRL